MSSGNSKLILKYLKLLASKDEKYASLHGENFLVNEDIVLSNPFNLNDRTLAEYVGLCSLRNYSNYKINGNPNLDIEYIPNYVPADVVRRNPLVLIHKTTLYFKYE
ncbi:hypothetical protein [Vibrio phage JSF12]|uniref:Uncharacterized protein n=2 Tax=Jesfedecavirus TaxID=2560156 RepID=A0A2D0YLU1_9CAUD|nr:hypothetical protein FDI98_gp082 [Vibrio phage JSF10]YP_009794814.1 hypothetical protein HOS35_gp131 [Vibrio phage JSF12]ASV43450.1 hypothetical protein [Vibrio phage JSF10]ASV43649.1 hypothetical protein [Vibrio phage JSF12]